MDLEHIRKCLGAPEDTIGRDSVRLRNTFVHMRNILISQWERMGNALGTHFEQSWKAMIRTTTSAPSEQHSQTVGAHLEHSWDTFETHGDDTCSKWNIFGTFGEHLELMEHI